MGKKKSSGKAEVVWFVLINSSSESTILFEVEPSFPSVENLYSLTVEPAELCAVILST